MGGYMLTLTGLLLLCQSRATAAAAAVARSKAEQIVASNATRLLNQLLKGYDNRQLPNHKGATIIKADLNIRSMGPISEVDMTYSMDAYFRQTWVDERLRFSGLHEMAVHISMLQKIWKPDTFFHNGKESYLHTITEPNKFLRINPDGTIYYSMRLTIKASCPMYLHNFPVDEQSCPLQFGSYAYTNNHVRYEWKLGANNSIKTAEGMRLSQFDLIGTTAWHQTEHTSYGDFSTLNVKFRLSRHMGYFLIQVYVPCMLIVVLSWVSFWLNREATADRVGLGITTMLTLTTTSMDTRDDLPKVRYATALDWFVNMCFGFVIGSLLQFAAVHYFTKIGSGEFEASPQAEDEDDNDLNEDQGLVFVEHDVEMIPGTVAPEDDAKNWIDESCWMTEDGRCLRLPTDDKTCVKCALGRQVKRQGPKCVVTESGQVSSTAPATASAAAATTAAAAAAVRDRLSRDSWFVRLARCLQSDDRYRRLMRQTASPTGVNSVSMIDRVSRVLFPAAFICLNCVYWIGYLRRDDGTFATFTLP